MTSQQELKLYHKMSTPLKYTLIQKGRHTYIKVGGCSAEFPYEEIKNFTFKEFDSTFRGVIEDVKNVYDTIIGAVMPEKEAESAPIAEAVVEVIAEEPVVKVIKKGRPKKAKKN